MELAVQGLRGATPDFVLIDGNQQPKVPLVGSLKAVSILPSMRGKFLVQYSTTCCEDVKPTLLARATRSCLVDASSILNQSILGQPHKCWYPHKAPSGSNGH